MDDDYSSLQAWDGEVDWDEVFKMARGIAIAASAVTVAVGGFMMASTFLAGGMNEKDQSGAFQKGKTIVKYAILALLAFILLPAVVNHAIRLISSNGGLLPAWKPPGT